MKFTLNSTLTALTLFSFSHLVSAQIYMNFSTPNPTPTPAPILSNLTTPTLNLTAITTLNNASNLQCWQLSQDFIPSTTSGTSGALNLFLGDLSNATYTIIPPRFNGGLHNAPAPQLVVFLSGLAHVTLPNSSYEAWVQGGKYGMIIAADIAGEATGHVTTYPSAADTVTLQIPFEGGLLPEYTVLYDGPCLFPEMVGI